LQTILLRKRLLRQKSRLHRLPSSGPRGLSE